MTKIKARMPLFVFPLQMFDNLTANTSQESRSSAMIIKQSVQCGATGNKRVVYRNCYACGIKLKLETLQHFSQSYLSFHVTTFGHRT